MQGVKTYQEKLFHSFQLSDRIPEDNFYRRLKDMLALDFLYELTVLIIVIQVKKVLILLFFSSFAW